MKNLFSSAFLVLISGALCAQVVSFNPKGGINFSGINDQPEGISTDNKIGFNAGFDLRIGEGTFFFQPGAFYYQYNQAFTVVQLVGTTATLSRDIKVQSIKVPAQLGIRLINTDMVDIRVNAGPAFNFPVKISMDDGDFDIDRQDYKDISIGANVGAGVDVAFFTFDVNYEFGLSDYMEFEGDNFTTGSTKQYVLSFAVGMNF